MPFLLAGGKSDTNSGSGTVEGVLAGDRLRPASDVPQDGGRPDNLNPGITLPLLSGSVGDFFMSGCLVATPASSSTVSQMIGGPKQPLQPHVRGKCLAADGNIT